jgi:hypothetical protein
MNSTIGDGQNARALAKLAPFVGVIAGGAARHGAVDFISDTWRSWLIGTDVGHATEAVLRQLGSATIDRSQIEGFAVKADDAEGRMRLLLATLIWGRGKSNGRMRPHIVRAVTHPTCDVVLAETQRLALGGDLAAAYGRWSLPGLQAPFFTKWLWASTSTLPPGEQALILDGRVWKSLGVLGWDSLVATGGDRNRARRYEAYVRTARQWARELTTSSRIVIAEDIEWALFHANGDFGRLSSPA